MDIPSFFNRLDFISILLPGYVLVIVYLILFRPELLFSEKTMPFDIFSSVVFIVTGPAFGLTFQMVHRGFWSVIEWVRGSTTEDRQFLQDYAKIRLTMTADEKLELDTVLCYYDFCPSTAIALLFLFFYGLLIVKLPLSLSSYQLWVTLSGALVLLAAWREEYLQSYHPMIGYLRDKYCPNTKQSSETGLKE